MLGSAYSVLPETPEALCQVAQGLIIHVLRGERYGVTLPSEQTTQVYTVRVEDMLAAMIEADPRPLTTPREPAARFIGTCRHYAVLLCSMFRARGIPARARNGFSAYLKRGRFSDHWVCEYWNGEKGRWRIADAQMDAVHRRVLGIDFDPLDVPRDEQIAAGEVWRRCRRGEMDPAQCGSLDIWGLDYVKDNLLRDVAALNKEEMLPWDGCALSEKSCDAMHDRERALLDTLAELTAHTIQFPAIRGIYAAHPELQAKSLPNPHATAIGP